MEPTTETPEPTAPEVPAAETPTETAPKAKKWPVVKRTLKKSAGYVAAFAAGAGSMLALGSRTSKSTDSEDYVDTTDYSTESE